MFEKQPLGCLVKRHIGGGTPSRQMKSFWKGPIPWASVKDFKDDQISLSETEEHISQEGLSASASNLIPENTVVICSRMAVGRAAITAASVAINQDLKALFARDGVDERYLLRLLHWVKVEAEKKAVGSTVKGIRIADLLALEVPIAPEDEQPAIANILDTLDTQIRQTEAIIAKLQQVKQGLLHDLLTRGIDENGQLRPPYEQAPELYKESPLGWVPKEWSTPTIHDVVDSLSDGPFGSNLKTEHYVDFEGVRVIRLQNISIGQYDDSDRAFISFKHADRLHRNKVVSGDILVASLGDQNHPVGRACLYPESLPDAVNKADCFRLRVKNHCHGDFLTHALNSDFARKQISGFEQGVTLKRINTRNLRKIVIPLPLEEEQDAIERRCKSINIELAYFEDEVLKLKKQKAGLMDDLLTGRVRVTELIEQEKQAS